jgi:hypothetical protein
MKGVQVILEQKVALAFHRIPRRKLTEKNGRYVDFFRKLQIGWRVEIECLAANPRVSIHVSARRTGIKISVKKLGDRRFAVTRIL